MSDSFEAEKNKASSWFRTLRDDRSKATRNEAKIDALDNCCVLLVALKLAAGQQIVSMEPLAAASDEVCLFSAGDKGACKVHNALSS